jgi:hypothetical protein
MGVDSPEVPLWHRSFMAGAHGRSILLTQLNKMNLLVNPNKKGD